MLSHQKGTLFERNEGFTLIETLVAIFVLVVGILALYSMQVTSIRYNATAGAMTTSSTWAADRVEQLLALDYDDQLLADDDDPTDLAPVNPGNGTAGLSDTGATADGSAVSPDGRYSIFWNVADSLNPNPNNAAISTVKAIRVTVQHNDIGSIKQVVLNYYKQKVF